MLAGAQYSALNTLHSTPCWLVQYYQCADWRAVCVSPRVAREARAARLLVNPAAHEAARQTAAIAAAKAPALCFAFARVLRQVSVIIGPRMPQHNQKALHPSNRYSVNKRLPHPVRDKKR